MTLAISPKPSPRSHTPRRRTPADGKRGKRRVLARYVDPRGRQREVIVRPGHAGSALVLDRDARTLGDRRLVAHLGADEPAKNAALVCRHYMREPAGRWCRALAPEDLSAPGPGAELAHEPLPDAAPAPPTSDEQDREQAIVRPALVDRHERAYRLGLVSSRLAIPELRWLQRARAGAREAPRPVSVREAIAALESYEPVRALTVQALSAHGRDPAVSVAVLRAELERMDASRIVLNRGLREAVLGAVRGGELSMSEIALRCGRVKYDARGNASGETSWLARRVGVSPEGGELEPTPWVHSEVLALIARSGLGISPREVELG